MQELSLVKNQLNLHTKITDLTERVNELENFIKDIKITLGETIKSKIAYLDYQNQLKDKNEDTWFELSRY